MIVYHFFYIGDFYEIFSLEFQFLPWVIFARCIQVIFLTLVGVSLVLSKRSGRNFYSKQTKRAAGIFLYGLLITLITAIFIPEDIVLFGILHQIAFSILILQFLAKKKIMALSAGLFIFALGTLINDIPVAHSFILNILGFQSQGYSSLDYFPIFPWMSLPAFGIFLGHYLYKNRPSGFFPASQNPAFFRLIAFLGKHALLIYMLHFVLIIATINTFILILANI